MKPNAWSHSALETFEQCPRKYEEVKVLRHFQDTKNPASLWGDRFHKHAEKFIREVYAGGPVTPLAAEMLPYSAYLVQFLNRPGKTLVEQEYALNLQLKPTEFYADDVWSRAILDVLSIDGNVAHIDDHKTGKNRKKDMQQLIIFAIHVFYYYPLVDTCHTAFHWVQHGFGEDAKDRETFHRRQLPELWAVLVPKLQRFKGAFNAGIFPPKPNGLCKKFCVVDTCEYWSTGSRR